MEQDRINRFFSFCSFLDLITSNRVPVPVFFHCALIYPCKSIFYIPFVYYSVNTVYCLQLCILYLVFRIDIAFIHHPSSIVLFPSSTTARKLSTISKIKQGTTKPSTHIHIHIHTPHLSKRVKDHTFPQEPQVLVSPGIPAPQDGQLLWAGIYMYILFNTLLVEVDLMDGYLVSVFFDLDS